MTLKSYPFNLYLQPHLLGILALEFASGLPFLLVVSTLPIWLIDSGCCKTTIGSMLLTTIPYALKFLWAPFIDQYPLPYLTRRFGQRRGWALLTQSFLILSLIGLSLTQPAHNIYLTALLSFLVSFCAASQDIVLDAYRIERLAPNELGAGAAMAMMGFRLGMWVSGAGALYLSPFMSWFNVYLIMAALTLIGPLAILCNKEPKPPMINPELEQLYNSGKSDLKSFITGPLKGFFQRSDWGVIILFILFYKVGDIIPHIIGTIFLLDLGFTNLEIANAVKTLGIFLTMVGGFLGGTLINTYGLHRSLKACCLLQIFSPLMFLVLAQHGKPTFEWLLVIMSIENIACGMATTGLIAYLSSLCSGGYTATQYAVIYSFSSLSRVILSSSASWLSDVITWPTFFLGATLACLPCLLLQRHLIPRHPA